VKVSASIMAHPDRGDLVDDLQARLDRDVLVYWDTEGPPSGNGDRVWRVARGAWSMFDPNADYHVLIQDDAVPCADYLAGLEMALDHVPDGTVVSPYLGTGRMAPPRWDTMLRTANASGACWIRAERVMWGVSLAVPVKDLPSMIAWCDRRARVADDMRVNSWVRRVGREVWYPWPSLVDHRLVPSLTKHRADDRVARRHYPGSALDLSWSGPVVTDPMLIRRRGSRSAPSANRKVTSLITADKTGKAGNRE
jgi:hypothetical protein